MSKPKKNGNRPQPAAVSDNVDSGVPAIDEDTLSIFQNQQKAENKDRGALIPPGDSSQFRSGIYASTKGALLVNDGIGYGEVNYEIFRYVSEGKFVDVTRQSVRTRTGRQTIVKKEGT